MGIDSPVLNSPESFLCPSGKNQDQPHVKSWDQTDPWEMPNCCPPWEQGPCLRNRALGTAAMERVANRQER